MNLIRILSLALLFFCAFTVRTLDAGDPRRVSREADRDSGAEASRQQVLGLNTPELERRNRARLELQRRGYSQTLYGVVRRNGFDSVLAYIKMSLQLEFFLPHDQLIAYFPVVALPRQQMPGLPGFTTFGGGMVAVPLAEDWRFPHDPWKKK